MPLKRLLEFSLAYRAIQAPFAQRKLAPVLADADAQRARRVLDVGCGPGTNAAHFRHTWYVGVDVNEAYVRSAQRRHAGRFLVADVTRTFVRNCQFDCILSNSLLHHIDEQGTRRALANLAGLLAPDGHVHILDLVLPESMGPARALARLDRGSFARSVEHWRELFGEHFSEERLMPYPLGLPALPLWHMVYFKGKVKRP